MSPSTSVSLVITLVLVNAESSSIVNASSTATGVSLTDDTVIVKVPVDVKAPSETV